MYRFKGLNRKIRSLETETFKLLPNIRIKIKGLPSIKVRAIPEGEINLIRIVNTASHVTVQVAIIKAIEVAPTDTPAVELDLGIHSLPALSDGTPFEGRNRDNAKIESLRRDLHLDTRKGKPRAHKKT